MRKALATVAMLLAAWTGAAGAAGVACQRPFNVPIAPLGAGVTVKGEAISGIYPNMLRLISEEQGCMFKLTLVPRARLEAMFESGQADLLVPATSTARRDRIGLFVPMIGIRPTLVSFDNQRAPVRSLADLIERRELRVALVRGNDYGPAYQAMVRQLQAQHRVVLEADVVNVARVLKAGMADVSVITPMSFAGAVKNDERVRDMLSKLRIEPLRELPWNESGIYISRNSVALEDQVALARLLREAFKTVDGWGEFTRAYPPEVIAASARRR